MKELFIKEITKLLVEAKLRGEKYITLKSGDIHRAVGGYPGKSHRMPTCCSVMRGMMKDKDEIIFQTPSGNGSTIEIKYYL